jgi:hypothetical protein
VPILKTQQVYSFGQMPGKIIYRHIEEMAGITLDEYLLQI